MGTDIALIAKGGREVVSAFRSERVNENAPSRYAGLHVIASKRRDQRIHVVMPYHSSMGEFARWVRQLVAESLGKKNDRSGHTVFEGVTPIAAIGPEDQHSQLQLYSEGPFDKLITFIGTKTVEGDMVIPSASDLPGQLTRFSGYRLSRLLRVEREATTESLRRMQRPNGTILMNRLDARSLGGLFMFYQIAVAMMGELLDVNAYDQPGVELSKKIMKESLMR
jgi:glucose-6-phosphate isomerase